MNNRYLVIFFAGTLECLLSAAEPSVADALPFYVGQPPEQVMLSQHQFQLLKNQSQLIQQMPESDDAYVLPTLNKERFAMLCMFTTIDKKAYLRKNEILSCILKKSYDNSLLLKPKHLTDEQKDWVATIDLPQLIRIMQDADYCMMDDLVKRCTYGFAAALNSEAGARSLLDGRLDSHGLTKDLKNRVAQFLDTHLWLLGPDYFKTDDVFVAKNVYELLADSYAHFSRWGNVLIYKAELDYQAAQPAGVVQSCTRSHDVMMLGVAHAITAAIDPSETIAAVKQKTGDLFVIHLDQKSPRWNYCAHVPDVHALAFDQHQQIIYLLRSGSIDALEYTNGKTTQLMTIPENYVPQSVSRYGQTFLFKHRSKDKGLIYRKDTNDLIPVDDVPVCCDDEGRYVLLASGTLYDSAKQRSKAMISTFGKFSIIRGSFSSDGSLVTLQTQAGDRVTTFPIYYIFSTDSATLKYIISPETTGESPRALFTCLVPLHVAENTLRVFDSRQKKIKSLQLIDKLTRHQVVSLEGSMLVKLMKTGDKDQLYRTYSAIYDTLPTSVKELLPIDLSTKIITFINSFFPSSAQSCKASNTTSSH